jgi:hypothetical protein
MSVLAISDQRSCTFFFFTLAVVTVVTSHPNMDLIPSLQVLNFFRIQANSASQVRLNDPADLLLNESTLVVLAIKMDEMSGLLVL